MAIAGMAVLLLVLGLAFADFSSGLPSLSQIPSLLDRENGLLLQPTRFYDRTGTHLIFELGQTGSERRFLSIDPTQPDHFSPQLTQVAVVLKQPDYWASPGFVLKNLGDPEPRTIAEELVDTLLLGNEDINSRKAYRMRFIAGQLIARYGHSQVLEWYLNSANFGHMTYGAESAAQLYFGKSASDLELLEAAFLIRISETPVLNPFDAPGLMEEMKQEVLDRLLTQGAIGAEQYLVYKDMPLEFKEPARTEAGMASAFILQAQEQLFTRLGRERVERGGLKVITSLDMELQDALICTTRVQLTRLTGQPGATQILPTDCEASRLLPTVSSPVPALPDGLKVSGVISDPRTGEVLAMLGDSTLMKEEAALNSHPPGSLLTPFVAIAAFARGYSPASMVWDIPTVLPADLAENRNPDGSFHGPVRFRTALANDYLAPIAQIMDQINPANLWRILEPLGISGVDRGNEGTSVLYAKGLFTTLEASQAYGVLAAGGQNNGMRDSTSGTPEPRLVLAVTDALGTSIAFDEGVTSQTVISAQLAYLVNHVLSDESARWQSLGNPNALEIGRPAGGKIGRVAGNQDIWAVGYTPQTVVSIWMGLPSGSEGYQLEAKMPAGITHALLQFASRGRPASGWEMPIGVSKVRVCDPSGLLPTKVCPNIVEEVFLSGSEPTLADNLYQKLMINRETGRLATVFTPPELLHEKTYLVVPEAMRTWAEAAGQAVPPKVYDIILQPAAIPDVTISSPAMFSYVRGKVAIRGTAAGPDFAGYRVEIGAGLNPATWLQVGSGNEARMDSLLAEWDTAGKNGLYAIRLLVLRPEQQFDSTTIQVAVDNTLPMVIVPYPQQGSTFKLSDYPAITLQASAEDAIGISRVEWWIDNQRVGAREDQPFVQTWPLSKGEHLLFVRAFDLAGNMGESEPVSFTVE